MPQTNERRGISRIDQPSKHTFGWYVRVRVADKVHSKFFPDNKFGGKGKSLRAAQTHRDQLMRARGKSSNGKKTSASVKPKPKADKKGTWVQLEPEVARVFSTPGAVNKALRQILSMAATVGRH